MTNYTKTMREALESMYISEDNVGILRDIVKRKSAMPLKFADGKMKVDLFTASAVTQVLDKVNPANKIKLTKMINTGKKGSFIKIAQVVMKSENDPEVEEENEGFASDAQRRAAFASGYKEKGKKKKEEVEIEEGKYLKYSDLLLKKARLIDKKGPDSSEVKEVNKEIKAEMKKLGIKEEVDLDENKLLDALKKKLSDEGGAAGFKDLEDTAKKMDVDLTPDMLKKMSGIKQHRDGDYILEEAELDEAKNYKIKNGKIHISKANFRKVHKDYKNSTKGKERMMALDPKSGATTSYEVVFEEVELDEALKTTHVIVDTAQGNKVISSAAGGNAEKNLKSSIASAERPPLSIKDKKTLKIVKLKKPVSQKKADDLMGQPLKEEVDNDDKQAGDLEKTVSEGRDTYKGIITDLLKDKKEISKKSKAFGQNDTKFIDKAINFLKMLEKEGIPAKQISQVDFVTNRVPKFFVGNPQKSPSFSKFTPNDVKKAVAHAKKMGIMKEEVEESYEYGTDEYAKHTRDVTPGQGKEVDEASARRDAMRDMGKRGKDSADVDDYKATADDRKAADKNIIMQLRKATNLGGKFEVEFKDKKKQKVSPAIAMAFIKKYEKMKPTDKAKLQDKGSKSYRDLLKSLKEEDTSLLSRIHKKLKEIKNG